MDSPLPSVRLAFYSIHPGECETDKPPIIFLHGASYSKENWNDIPRKVANITKRNVFAVDLRNHGDSEWSDDFSFLNYAKDVLHFMNSIQAPKAIFVGHSLGGLIAMIIAGMANARVEKIVVEDKPIRKVENYIYDMFLLQLSLGLEAIQQLPVGLDEDAAKVFIADFVYKGLPTESKKNINKIETKQYDFKLKPTEDGRYTFKSNLTAIREAVIELQETHPEPTGIYDGPAFFIYGKKSPSKVDTDEENIKKFFPNAELVGIENAGHFVHSDCPIEFTEELLKFILKP